jgi:RNA polymerase sigma factor (sigma-70 family)
VTDALGPTPALRRPGVGTQTNRRALDEDRQAQLFRQVVLPHLADALALARWLAGNLPDAEDIVQESCVRALRGIAGYDGRNSRAWVLAIVRNTAFTWLAKHRSKALVMVGDLADIDEAAQAGGPGNADPQPTPEAELIRRADASTVEAAIAALALPYREILVLRDINGLSYKEIAQLLSLPIGTVMSRLARARQQLTAGIKRVAS